MGFWKKEKSFVDPNSGARVTWWGVAKDTAGKAADTTYSTAKTVAEAIQQWVKENPKEARSLEKAGATLDYTILRDPKYRDVHFEGSVIVGSKWCNTVGEWQDAINDAYKDYHDGISYGNNYDSYK